MTASNADEAVANSLRFSSCVPGKCLMYVRTWLEIGSRDASAAEAWRDAGRKHEGDRTAPRGAPVFWAGGSRGYGHIALSLGRGLIRTTDVPTGRVGVVSLSYVEKYWGQRYMGWTEDLNGVVIPWLAELGKAQSQWSHGDVYVDKLHHGQKDSDSVARLSYRLKHHLKIPNNHRPKRIYQHYNDDVQDAVRFWQRNLRPNVRGPSDGSRVSNRQAEVLFGKNYRVHKDT